MKEINNFTKIWKFKNKEGKNKILKSLTLKENEIDNLILFCSINNLKITSLINYFFYKNGAFDDLFIQAWSKQKRVNLEFLNFDKRNFIKIEKKEINVKNKTKTIPFPFLIHQQIEFFLQQHKISFAAFIRNELFCFEIISENDISSIRKYKMPKKREIKVRERKKYVSHSLSLSGYYLYLWEEIEKISKKYYSLSMTRFFRYIILLKIDKNYSALLDTAICDKINSIKNSIEKKDSFSILNLIDIVAYEKTYKQNFSKQKIITISFLLDESKKIKEIMKKDNISFKTFSVNYFFHEIIKNIAKGEK